MVEEAGEGAVEAGLGVGEEGGGDVVLPGGGDGAEAEEGLGREVLEGVVSDDVPERGVLDPNDVFDVS